MLCKCIQVTMHFKGRRTQLVQCCFAFELDLWQGFGLRAVSESASENLQAICPTIATDSKSRSYRPSEGFIAQKNARVQELQLIRHCITSTRCNYQKVEMQIRNFSQRFPAFATTNDLPYNTEIKAAIRHFMTNP